MGQWPVACSSSAYHAAFARRNEYDEHRFHSLASREDTATGASYTYVRALIIGLFLSRRLDTRRVS